MQVKNLKKKNNKASAYDMIKNEMFKSALPFISTTVVKLFNVLLKTGFQGLGQRV